MSMNDREQAFESKFKHDEELKFRIAARTAKLFGQWVAQELGLTPEKVAEYGKEMVSTQLDAPGNEDILAKAESDLKAAGKDYTRHSLDTKVSQLEVQAKEQLMSEDK